MSPTGIWIVTLVHGAAFWLWHDPDLYDAAVRNGALHTLEHATFVITALVYWWTIVHAGEAGERGYVLAMLASVVTVIQGSVLGLLMLVASTPWYAVYDRSPGALSDQQGAAALMWGVTGSVYMLAVAVLLWRLLAEARPPPGLGLRGERVEDVREDPVGRLQVALDEALAELGRPTSLRTLDLPERLRAERRQAHELRAAMARVLLVGDEAVACEHVGDALHALPGEAPGARDLRDRAGAVLDRGEHAPARARLSERGGQRVSGCGQDALEPEDADGQLRYGIARSRRAPQTLTACCRLAIPIMTAFCHTHSTRSATMDWKLELLPIPVTDVDRAKAFYVEQAGFIADHDHAVSDDLRFVQLTPSGLRLLDRPRARHQRRPSRQRAGAARRHRHRAAHAELAARGVDVGEVQQFPWGEFVFFEDPDGNRWSVQGMPPRS